MTALTILTTITALAALTDAYHQRHKHRHQPPIYDWQAELETDIPTLQQLQAMWDLDDGP